MQWTALFFLGFCLQVSAGGMSQTVTFSGKNVPLKTIFKVIKQQTGFEVLSKNEYLAGSKPVTITATARPLQEFLEEVLQGQELIYELKGNTIAIGKKATGGRVGSPQISPVLNAPPITVRGRVINEKGEPVVASVVIKGGTAGTTSDAYGYFSLRNIEADAVLIISGVNIESREVTVNGQESLNIQIITKVAAEEEVTINGGYYKTTQKLKTSNISKVSGKDIERQPVTSTLMALQGRVPGLEISPVTGAAAAAPKIQIRGQNSLRFNGSLPLYIIDGVQIDANELRSTTGGPLAGGVDPLSALDPANIESIEILKDADATSIYGSKGANGVIVIKTRSHNNNGKTNFDVSAYSGWGKLTKKLKMLNTSQYLEMRNEAYANDGLTPAGSAANDLLLWDTTRYTDWQEELLGEKATITDIRGTVSAGNSKTSIALGVGYHKENTIYPGDFGFKRYTANIDASHTSTNNKFKMSVAANYGYTWNMQFDEANYVYAALLLPPVAPPLYTASGELNWAPRPTGTNSWINPLSYLRRTDEQNLKNLVLNTNLSYEVLPGVFVKASLGYSDLSQNENLKNPLSAKPPVSISPTSTAIATFNTNKRSTWIIEPQLNYLKQFASHRIGIYLGSSFQSGNYQYLSIAGYGYSSDLLLNSLLGATETNYSETNGEYKYEAGFLRLSYDYDQKYLVNITGRRDGSSRFGPGHRFGNFGAVGLGWIFSNENFLKRNSVLSFGKIRASYGTSGNDQFQDYAYLNSYTLSQNSYAYLGVIGLGPTSLYNPNLAWEVTRKAEAGIELGFLKNRINIEVSYYRNRSSNQLVDYPLPLITGFRSVIANFGALIQNTGTEIVLNSTVISQRRLKWDISANASVPRNKLVKFNDIENSSYATTYKVGEPLSVQVLAKYKGINSETGLYEVEDINNDGVINLGDRVFSTAITTKYYGGINNTVSYKSFQLSFLLQFSKKNAYADMRRGYPGSPATNQPVDVLNRWRKPGDNALYAKFSRNSSTNIDFLNNVLFSDHSIVDASFLRLKTVSFSYQLPKHLINKAHLENALLYLQAQNLLTITNYDGLDPETGYGLPPLKMITLGVQFRF